MNKIWRVGNPAWLITNRRKAWFWCLMQLRYFMDGIRFPPTSDIWGLFYVFKHSQARITIGEYVTFRNSLKYNPAGVIHPTVLRAAVPGANLIIGDHVGISGAIICCETTVKIGSHSLLGANCSIYDTDYHPLDHLARRNYMQSEVKRSPVTIGEDCWIGANAVILKGVSIGARSVIGANAVVSRDIPPDSIAVGNPATIVGKVPRAVSSTGI